MIRVEIKIGIFLCGVHSSQKWMQYARAYSRKTNWIKPIVRYKSWHHSWMKGWNEIFTAAAIFHYFWHESVTRFTQSISWKKKIYQVVARLRIGISATPIESKVFEAQTKYGMCCVLIIRFNLVCENIRIFTFSLRHVHMCVQLAKICTWTFSQQLTMIYLSFRVHLLFSPHFRSIAVSFSPMPTDIDVFV